MLRFQRADGLINKYQQYLLTKGKTKREIFFFCNLKPDNTIRIASLFEDAIFAIKHIIMGFCHLF